MEDSRNFGLFSIALGGTIIVLSSFLDAIPGILIISALTGVGILSVGVFTLAVFMSDKRCPECGEVLDEENSECGSCCGSQPSNLISPSQVGRLLH